jgi:hypothetical protein
MPMICPSNDKFVVFCTFFDITVICYLSWYRTLGVLWRCVALWGMLAAYQPQYSMSG